MNKISKGASSKEVATASKGDNFGRAAVVVLLISLVAVGLGCYPSHNQSTFDAAGTVAQKQLSLFLIIFWTAAVVFVAVEGALIYAALKFRRKPGQELPRQTHGHKQLEVAWTIAPALILVVIAVPTIITIFDTANTPNQDEVLRVNVRGHQWWWEFQYPELGMVTANELHVPPEPWVVEVGLESDDVIHSFWIPKLTGKMDVIPNNRNQIWFSGKRPGTYYGLCAEFCGTAHAQMRFRVVVERDKAAFDSWVASQKADPQQPTTDLARQGQRVFGLKGCGVCHTVSGPEAEGLQGERMEAFLRGEARYPAPNLTHFASRSMLAAGLLDRTDDNLSRWLQVPNEVKPGNRMYQLAGAYTNPRLTLTDEDIAALVGYLQSLK